LTCGISRNMRPTKTKSKILPDRVGKTCRFLRLEPGTDLRKAIRGLKFEGNIEI
jgi:hypothetical protein